MTGYTQLNIVEGSSLDGNYRVEIYMHLLVLTRNSSEKCNCRSLAVIEPAALQFRCSALPNIYRSGKKRRALLAVNIEQLQEIRLNEDLLLNI
jgi:hypothetical protein